MVHSLPRNLNANIGLYIYFLFRSGNDNDETPSTSNQAPSTSQVTETSGSRDDNTPLEAGNRVMNTSTGSGPPPPPDLSDSSPAGSGQQPQHSMVIINNSLTVNLPEDNSVDGTSPGQTVISNISVINELQVEVSTSSSSPGGDQTLPKYKRDLVQKMKVLRMELQTLQPQSGHCRFEVCRKDIFEVSFLSLLILLFK